METQKFTRKPFSLEAVQVTPTNINEVAKWCGGTVAPADYKMMGGVHKMAQGSIMLPKQGPKSNKTHRVLIGHWITKHREQFRNWTLEAFQASFTPAELTSGFEKNDLVKVGQDPDVQAWEGWEGRVVDPVLIGVDFGIRGLVVFEPKTLIKISEMDSLQLEFNAGIEMDMANTADQLIEQMRQASKETIAALEKENLAYDETEIRVGDLVKTSSDPKLVNEHYQGQCGHVQKIDNGLYTVEFATADPDKPDVTDFTLEALTKLQQDGEVINECATPAFEQAVITVGQARIELGMDPTGVPEVDEQPLSDEAKELFASMTGEQREQFAAVQKVGEEEIFGGEPLSMFDTPPPSFEVGDPVTVNHAISQFHNQHGIVDQADTVEVRVRLGATVVPFAPTELVKADFEVGNMIETLVEHEFDGVTIPAGTNGQITVTGVSLEDDHRYGFEVLFADGHHHAFAPYELKKI